MFAGVVLRVNVTVDVCRPRTGLVKSTVAVLIMNGLTIILAVAIEPVTIPVIAILLLAITALPIENGNAVLIDPAWKYIGDGTDKAVLILEFNCAVRIPIGAL